MTYEYVVDGFPNLDAISAAVEASSMDDKSLSCLTYCGSAGKLWATFDDALCPSDRSAMLAIVEANS